MSVRFAVYARPRNAAQARSFCLVDNDSANAVSKLYAAFYDLTTATLNNLISKALAMPLVEHKHNDVVVWAVPIIP